MGLIGGTKRGRMRAVRNAKGEQACNPLAFGLTYADYEEDAMSRHTRIVEGAVYV
jgi:hypothetical protein